MISPKLWLLLPILQSTVVLSSPLASPCSHDASSSSSPSVNQTSRLTAAWSTRMISSIISRQQGLVSSGEVTSTLESGLISIGVQSWLDLYATASSSSSSSSDDQTTTQDFASYVDAILQGVSATAAFTNVSAAARTPLDRLTVAQAIAGLEREPASVREGEDSGRQPETNGGGGGGGGGRQLTADETQALSALNQSLAIQERNQYGGFWYVFFSLSHYAKVS